MYPGPTVGDQSHDFVATSSSTITSTFEPAAPLQEYVFNSYDTIFADGVPQGTLSDISDTYEAELELYLSDGPDSVVKDSDMDEYSAVAHTEAFNELSNYWTFAGLPFGDYPYIGKNSNGRISSEGNVSSSTWCE